ncbi:NmrA/HSCARG family protein [Streptomyces albireticuli]|uniref:NmrA family transcriptional regulator n=1 Tax=Streptomyces albireticuli TaxID=1940 RepID=A0A2A2DEA2_9ACTN|nr:NmrA/HSCARG family protein [Streptomyces albireticuli]MCD9140889.1 NmrA/HSCARG family protein [Streptomyces albireticuli]MCD9161149.1 NmrA/HSCARG family protein [Streptomyces albireticuli]MCD9190793.1 NmrA/HSCARG family protein [Streptomyces albireticuli]PAU49776.1 NmrA family transcriptional regulator [Streptomyces albireticuli]
MAVGDRDTDRWVLVLGATGRQGGTAARHLLDRGWAVRALVRDPEHPRARELQAKGVRLVKGSLDDPAAVRGAVAGAYGVFTVFTPTHGNGLDGEERHAALLASAVRDARVAHLVHSSVGGVENPGGVGWRETKLKVERTMRAAGVPTTFLRAVYYMENFLDLPPVVDASGQLVLSRGLLPETRLQMIASQDIGWFVADAFDDPGYFTGRNVEIAGDELTGPQIAEAFARHTGSPARFESVPIEEIRRQNEWMAKTFVWFNEVGYTADIPALRAAHPGLLTFDAFLRGSGWSPRDPE